MCEILSLVTPSQVTIELSPKGPSFLISMMYKASIYFYIKMHTCYILETYNNRGILWILSYFVFMSSFCLF